MHGPRSQFQLKLSPFYMALRNAKITRVVRQTNSNPNASDLAATLQLSHVIDLEAFKVWSKLINQVLHIK